MAKAVWLTLCFLVWTTLAMKGERGPKGDTGDFQNAGWKRFDWIILQMMLLHSYLPNVLLQNSATLKTLCLIGSQDAMTATMP